MKLLPGLLVVLCTGCASTLSTMQTARPLAPRQLQVSGGVGVFVPAGQLVTVAETGIEESRKAKDAAERGESYSLDEETQSRLLTAGIALAVAPPGMNNEVMVRMGVVENLEVGVRYSGISVRADGKFRFLHGGDPEPNPGARQRRSYDLAIGLGVARHIFKSPVLDLLELVQIDDFSRFDVEVPLYASAEYYDIVKLYAAPKYVFSRTSMDQKLVDYSERGSENSGADVRLPARVNSHFVGTTVGLALGYRYVHLYAELTGGYSRTRLRLFGQQRNLGGLTLYPAVGLAVRFGAPRQDPAPSSSPAAPATPSGSAL